MKAIFFLSAFYLLSGICRSQSRPEYPAPPLSHDTDIYFGKPVADLYRPLENDSLKATQEWLKAEESLSATYLKRAVRNYFLEPQLLQNSYAVFPATDRQGCYYFQMAKSFDALEASLYVHKKLKGEGVKVVDPSWYLHGRGDRVRITGYALSEDNTHLAYSISHRGSDWQEIHVRNIDKAKELEDVISDVKFSSIEWSGSGFYYMRYAYAGNNRLMGRTERGVLCYHRMGEAVTTDRIVYAEKADSLAQVSFEKPPGGHLIIYDRFRRAGKAAMTIQSLCLKGADAGKLHTILQTDDGGCHVVGVYNNKFLVRSTTDAPHGRLLLFDTTTEGAAEEFVPEHKEILHDASIIGDKVVCIYLDDIDYLTVTYDSSAAPVNAIQYPSGSSVGNFIGTPADSVALFWYYSFLHPPVVYEYNVNSMKARSVDETKIAFDHKAFVVEKVHYAGKDGAQIPMMIAYQKGLKRDGKAPTILYGYGGNGVVMTPFFSRNFLSHMQNGGIIALPCIRGGSEYGADWHRQGARAAKQQGFDDFIRAAEFLFKEGYTSKEKLALLGGSNGGLLVAAVVNQRPDICKVAVAEHGVYDMLRFQQFTIGHAWQNEYGYNDDSVAFNYLYAYSPLHNIKQGVAYPAMLITTADHDDRVVPLHSYKYVAALQAASSSDAPILLTVAKNAGHQTSSIEEDVRIYSFIYQQLGLSPGRTGLR